MINFAPIIPRTAGEQARVGHQGDAGDLTRAAHAVQVEARGERLEGARDGQGDARSRLRSSPSRGSPRVEMVTRAGRCTLGGPSFPLIVVTITMLVARIASTTIDEQAGAARHDAAGRSAGAVDDVQVVTGERAGGTGCRQP